LPPHVKKHVAQQVFGDRLIADEAQKPAIDVGAMPDEKGLHREAIASGVQLVPWRAVSLNPRLT
jgi:hypothetical protein